MIELFIAFLLLHTLALSWPWYVAAVALYVAHKLLKAVLIIGFGESLRDAIDERLNERLDEIDCGIAGLATDQLKFNAATEHKLLEIDMHLHEAKYRSK